jgi:tetratricopeptide (TPR) repeat protein
MNRPTALLFFWILIGALSISALPARAADDAGALDSKRVEAESLYAQGRYAEALPLLEQLDAAGAATGPLLYRLNFCQLKTGDTAGSAATQRRAVESLERELASAQALEVPFYLANAYRNAGRTDDARRVAAEATTRVERAEIPEPDSGPSMFQLGKLYADQGLEQPATKWYSRAVDALTQGPHPGGPYVRWASRYLAEAAYGRKDFTTAQRYYTSLTEAGEGTAQDFDRLAISRVRVGMFAEAADAWRLVETMNSADPNRARYGARLSTVASKQVSLSENAPSGKPWIEATREELEAAMKEQAGRVRAVLQGYEERGELDKATQYEYRKQLNEAKTIFVPAALEYMVRGHDIRQTAFFGGYARLILSQSAWKPPWRTPAKEGGEAQQTRRAKPAKAAEEE